MKNETNIEKAYNASNLHGRDLAELEIEARRDAHEFRSLDKNPYEKGSFPWLVYNSEIQKLWSEQCL